jgi:hypothetical protein
MPQFKSTQNIFKDFGDEVFNKNWMDSDTLILPPSPDWSYDRVMEIEDVDIWEVIVERGGGVAVYAAWCPYAEFYLVRYNLGQDLEAFYGRFVQPQLLQRLEELRIPYPNGTHFRFAGRENDKNYGKILNGRTAANSGIITSF